VELKYSSPLELMVAAILAAQCTDERVNKVTGVSLQEVQDDKGLCEGC